MLWWWFNRLGIFGLWRLISGWKEVAVGGFVGACDPLREKGFKGGAEGIYEIRGKRPEAGEGALPGLAAPSARLEGAGGR